MPIEFSCPQCSRILRVSDEHAGKPARCPDCATVMYVPGGDAPPEPQPSMDYKFDRIESPIRHQNPPGGPTKQASGQSPWGAQGSVQRSGQSFGRTAPNQPKGAVRPTAASIESIVSYAWKALMANFGLVFIATAITMGIGICFGIAQAVVDEMMQPGGPPGTPGSIPGALIGIFSYLVMTFVGIGQVRINFDIARTGRAEIATLFSGGDRYLPILGASFVAGIAMSFGLICLVIPGLILITLFWPYFHLIADRKETAMGSFNTAMEIGKINVGTTVLLFLLTIGAMFAGLLTLLTGYVIILPFLSMLWSVAYLKMAGQI